MTKKVDLTLELYILLQTAVTILCILVIINVFFLRISSVSGSSMIPTFREKDQVVSQILGYDTPQYGDIVVIDPGTDSDAPYVKRIIGLAGDVIDMDMQSGTLYINGQPQREEYINEVMRKFGTISYPYTVPEDYVFVMGDNRNNSDDSRNSSIGALPIDNIVGKVVLRIWPLHNIKAF